jgi:hypothetical protein
MLGKGKGRENKGKDGMLGMLGMLEDQQGDLYRESIRECGPRGCQESEHVDLLVQAKEKVGSHWRIENTIILSDISFVE